MINRQILLMAVLMLSMLSILASCQEEEEILPQQEPLIEQSNSELGLETESSNSRVKDAVPACNLTSVDWDGISMEVGARRTFGVEYVFGAEYVWRTSGSIIIIGRSDLNTVTVEAYRAGVGTLTVTMNGPADNACSFTGDINVIEPPCVPPTPSFHVMDPNWNSNGETCANYVLELGVVSDERCDDFQRYEWSIQGATILNITPDGRYIYVRTGGLYTNLTFRVRGIYSSGATAWSTQYGRTVPCYPGGGGQL